ncbi:tail fiber assembly protein [Photorhabdus asymbiotica]|uniref:tail fiber assembly protein n=1 Tax=Photorhabdus asymbiotica TaxID=291112 RepID=UPI003DA73AE2
MNLVNLGPFEQYIPDSENAVQFALYLQDKQGNDWYTSQNQFSTETLKIMYDANGLIRAITTDVSKFAPLGFSVAEINKNEVPKEFNEKTNHKWMFDGQKIFPYVATKEELIRNAEYKRVQLLVKANNIIVPLQDAIDLNIATEEEKNTLLKWKKYRIMLNRIDISTAPEIVWPTPPLS